MSNEDRLRASLPNSYSSAVHQQRMQFSQSAQTSPTQQPVTMLSGRMTPLEQLGIGRTVGSFDPRQQERPTREQLRYTLNPRELGSSTKLPPSWQLSTQREEMYSNPSLSMSSSMLHKNVDTGKPGMRPNLPFPYGSKPTVPILKDKGSSPSSEVQRSSGHEIQQKINAYFSRNKSSHGEPVVKPRSPEQDKQEPNCSNEEEKSFYSDLFTSEVEEELERSAPMFVKRNLLDFPYETKTPKIDIKRIIEMEPKRNTNLPVRGDSEVEGSPASSPLTASFKRQPRSNPVSSIPGLKLEDFQLVKPIGSGRFGKVFLSRHKSTKTIYALKKMSKKLIKSLKMEHQVILEIKLQMFLEHPNIVKLYGFFDDSENIYLMMEYMEEGTLYQRMQSDSAGFKQEQIAITTFQVSRAIHCLDDKFIAHRDIKPQNILMSHVLASFMKNLAKLSDFGWSTICNDRRTTYCATPAYISPEMIEGKDYDQTIDLWCLGVLVYEMVTGKVPFTNPSKRQTERQILNADITKLIWPQTTSPEIRDFVQSLLKRDPQSRLKAANLLKHPFLAGVCQD